jgi:integrase
MANIQEVPGKNGIKYRVLIRMKGCPPQSATFARRTDAKKWAQDTESAIRDGRYFKTAEAKRHTIEDMIDKYIKGNLVDRKSAVNTKHHLLYWKSKIGARMLSDLTPDLIGDVRDSLLNDPYITSRKIGKKVIETERKRSGATVNRYMAAFGHCLTVAVREWRWMESNPMPNITKSKESKGRVRFLSDEERERLLTACKDSQNPYLYPVVVLALSTGMRQGEIMNLTWDDIDFVNRRLILHETKNGERRAVHLAGKALELLQALKKQKVRRIDNNLVFPGTHVLNRGPASLRTAWLFALKKANVTDFKFHDLRHSAASYLAMNGASLIDIAAVLGHKTLAMVKRYSHLSDSHTLGVVERMNQKIFGG